MGDFKVDAARLAGSLGYSIPDSDLSDYEAMLGKAISAFELVEGMEGLRMPCNIKSSAYQTQTISLHPTSRQLLVMIFICQQAMRILLAHGRTAALARTLNLFLTS